MKIGIIGCGNMGSALARGIMSRKILPFNNIFISDKDAQKTKELYKKFGPRISTNEEIAKKCNFIIVAVKPQDSQRVLVSIAKDLDDTKHLISIMAGVSISRMEKTIKKRIAVTRAMPNMAALAGRSVTCVAHNKIVKDETLVEKIFSSIGDVIEIEEKLMDAVTAVIGSGPAYFFYLTELLKDAAVKMGIRKELATKMAAVTLIGSGALLDVLDAPPKVLRKRITSKRGTTDAAIRVLKSRRFKAIIIEAVKAATERSKELSKSA